MKIDYKRGLLCTTLLGNIFAYFLTPSYGMDRGNDSTKVRGIKAQLKGSCVQDRITSFSLLEWRVTGSSKKQRELDSQEEKESAETSFQLGKQHESGQGVEQSYAVALQCYLKAAEKNHASAQHRCWLFYYRGLGVKHNYDEVVKWFYKKQNNREIEQCLKAAKQGDPEAQVKVGNFYLVQGAEKDFAEAMQWFCKAADQKNIDANIEIGRLYEAGMGVPQDYERAAWWFKKAISQNLKYAVKIGDLYYYGRKHIKYAAKIKHLKWYFQNPNGITQDYTKAMGWYLKAAEQNNAWAQHRIGDYYYKGQGVKKDYKEAIRWYHKEAVSRNNLDKVKRYSELMECYHKAEENDSEAQNAIGVYFYENKDFEEASKWYTVAENIGNKMAQKNLEKMQDEILSSFLLHQALFN